MGVWDDVDYRKCERCGKSRHVSGMSVKWPAGIWLCLPCVEARREALNELFAMGQDYDSP